MSTTNHPSLVAASAGGKRVFVIESLRGLAALGVLFFHSLTAFKAENTLNPVLGVIRRFTEYGYLGVSVFFAISGWCIAQRLHAAFQRNESVPVFLLERILRIFPVYWAALLLALGLRLAAVPFRHSLQAANLPDSPLAWLGDLFLVQPYLGTPAYVMVSWSLVFELGFYVIAAGALAGRRSGLRTGWLLLAGLVLSLSFFIGPKPRLFFVLDRWPDFFSGMLAWWLVRQSRWSTRSAGITALLALIFLTPSGFADIHRLTAVGTSALLVVAAFFPPPKTAAIKFLAWAGGISYSLYLIHLAVISPFMNLSQRLVPARDGLFVGIWIVAIILSVTAGWGLNRWIETPVEHWRRALFVRRRAIPSVPHA